MAIFGSKSSPQINPVTVTETVHDVEADNVSIDVVLAEVDSGSGFTGVNDPASNVSWLSVSTSSSTPMDVTNVDIDITVDPADIDIGNKYRIEITADDGTDTLTKTKTIEVLNELPFPTAGFTVDATWDDDSDYQDLASATVASSQATVSISSGDDGVIMEAGASGSGMALWAESGNLFFACGDGGSTGPTASTAWISGSLPTGNDLLITWSASTVTDNAALYVGDQLIGTDTFDNSTIAGENDGGIGRIHNGIRNGVNPNTDDFDGTVTKAEIYLDEATPEVR